MTIVIANFAQECVLAGQYRGILPHYLIATAWFRSHVVDDTDGDKVGPFRLTKTDWDDNRNDPAFDIAFLPTDITIWRAQCMVFASMASKTRDALISADSSAYPSASAMYGSQWPLENVATLASGLDAALDATAPLVAPAYHAVFDDTSVPPIVIPASSADPVQPTAGLTAKSFDLRSLKPKQLKNANIIVDAFGKAGYGIVQQAAALANAMGESGLNEAVSVFVTKLERPKNPQLGISTRLKFAHRFLPQALV